MILSMKVFPHFKNDVFFEFFNYGKKMIFDKTNKINFDKKIYYEPRMTIILKILLGILLSMIDP